MNGSSMTLAAAGLLALAGAAQRGARAMKTPRDLGPGVTVVIQDYFGEPDRDVEIDLYDRKRHVGNIRLYDYFLGEVYADLAKGAKPKLDRPIWSVCQVQAVHGYGPLLYDLALECVHLVGGQGLIPDRGEVSYEASKVWTRYRSRHDVEHKPIPQEIEYSRMYSDEANRHGDEYPGFRPDLDQIYSKSNAPTIYRLLQRGKLKFEPLVPSKLRSALEDLEKQVDAASKPLPRGAPETIRQLGLQTNQKYVTRLNKHKDLFQISGEACAWDINCGDCEDWAYDMSKALRKHYPDLSLDVRWLNELDLGYDDEGNNPTPHAVLVVNGRYYDSQHLDGVADLEDLDLVRGVSRQDFLARGSRAVSPADLGYSRKEISLAERALEHTPSGASAGPSEADLVGKVYPKAWFIPPARVRRAARLGLKLRKQLEATHRVAPDGGGPGGTWIGVGRALQLATHDVVPPRDLRRIVSYSERHAVDRKAPGFGDPRKPTKGFIAELLWGNDAAGQGAKAWAKGVLEEMQEHDLRHGVRHGRK